SRLDFVMKPDIVAPGNRVISLDSPNSYLDNTYGASCNILWSAFQVKGSPKQSSRYYVLSGTSMAAPVVAGAAALMLQSDPPLSPDTIKARLMISADKWSDADSGDDVLTYGAG